MIRNSIVTRLWLTIITILIVSMVFVGFSLFHIVDRFYYAQVTKNLTYQAQQIAMLYAENPGIFDQNDEINRITHIINAHAIILDKDGIIQTCNSTTHLSPGSVFKESELSGVFEGKSIVKSTFQQHFNTTMLTVGIPIQREGAITEALFIYTPVEPVSGALDYLRTLLLSASLSFIIIASILVFFLSRSLSRPLIRMNQFALGLAKGDFTQKIRIKSKDEVGVLGATLNYLSEQLSKNITELSLEKEKVENILESMSDGVITVDVRGKIILTNPQARKLLGNKLLIETDNSFADSEELEQLFFLYRHVLETMQSTRGEFEFRGKVISVRLSPLFDFNTGILNGCIIILQDITGEKKLEEMRRGFIANVSHELRTPVTLIQGYSEAMFDIADSPEQQENFARTIFAESNRLKRLVEELLELSRLESGVISLQKESVDIQAIFNQISKKFEAALKDNKLILDCETAADAQYVRVDRFRFEQILINLIDNSIRYTSEGIIKLTTRKRANGIEIRVSDTGTGIAAEDLPYVFERFYRADKSRNRESGGTGLGLAIVKNLVEAHGGSITAMSNTGTDNGGVNTEIIMFFPNKDMEK